MASSYVAFAPSFREKPAATPMAEVPADEPIEVSIYLKPREGAAGATRAEMVSARAASHQSDIALIKNFAQETGLHVVSVEPGRRLVKLSGPASVMQDAFRVKLSQYHDGKHEFRGRSGPLFLPEELTPVVEAVLGLDTRPAAQPKLVFNAQAVADARFLPNAVAGFYGAPKDVDGAGECIALIELGGGFNKADTAKAFKAMGLAPPHVVAVAVDGGKNKPKPDDGADGEVALDIQVAGGVAPGAKIAVYFTPNTDAGFVDAITAAAHDTTNAPSIMSISWGSAEANWTAQSMTTMTSALQDAAMLNISVFVASGDNLASDGVKDGKAHVDFPASSPWAIGCGGTNIAVAGGKITAERVWNNGDSGTGGGISDVYPVPAFQAAAHLPVSVNPGGKAGRGVPDVAGNADPNSGYVVVVGGKQEVVGGTSAVAPLWAGFTALNNQKTGKPAGFFLPKLYAGSGLVRDVTQGNNIPAGSTLGYNAGPGWDACTGLGVPVGASIAGGLVKTVEAVG